MKKSIFLLFTAIWFTPFLALAHFDQIIQQDLQEKWLPQLEGPDQSQRFQASQVLLSYPQWSLPLLRQTLNDSKYTSVHWKIVHLLGALGNPTDIPQILTARPEDLNAYQDRIWLGAAERIFWRHRKSPSKKFIISRLRLLPGPNPSQSNGESNLQPEATNQVVQAVLQYKIVNPDNEGRLLEVTFHTWRRQLVKPHAVKYHWLEAGRDLTSEIVLELLPSPSKNIRIDFKVKEVGKAQVSASRKIVTKVP